MNKYRKVYTRLEQIQTKMIPLYPLIVGKYIGLLSPIYTFCHNNIVSEDDDDDGWQTRGSVLKHRLHNRGWLTTFNKQLTSKVKPGVGFPGLWLQGNATCATNLCKRVQCFDFLILQHGVLLTQVVPPCRLQPCMAIFTTMSLNQ